MCGLPGLHRPDPTDHLQRQQCVCAEHCACQLQGKEELAGPAPAPRQSLVGRRMAADAAQRTLDAADSIIFSGHKRHDRSSKKPKSPLLSPGQVRSAVVCCTSQLYDAPVNAVVCCTSQCCCLLHQSALCRTWDHPSSAPSVSSTQDTGDACSLAHVTHTEQTAELHALQ